MTDFNRGKSSLENPENKIAYLERKLKRLQENQQHQEKLEDLNRLLLKNALQELERSREKAENANRAKTDFLANMSHEIRTPLNIILGMSELLENTGLSDKQQQFVEKGREAGRHLLELINNILEFSRIERGSVRLNLQPFDLKVMAENLAATFNTICRQRGLAFSLDYEAGECPLFWGDEPKIRQILLNLLTNAVKFTDQGYIRFLISSEPSATDTVRFIVEDSGIGISEDYQNRIFERFNQAESPLRKSRQGGVGLGLAIVKLLATKMGGSIDVESEVARGSRFFVSLPLKKAESKARLPNHRSSARDEAPDLENLSILVVDDVPGNLYVVENYLNGFPLNALYSSSGRQAVELYRRNEFDVVLMDICMPEIDGIKALKQIRSFEQDTGRRPSCIIAMTAHAFQEIHADLQDQGFNMLLTKPFSRDELITTLGNRNHNPLTAFPAAENSIIAGQSATADMTVPKSLLPMIPILLERMSHEHTSIIKAIQKNDYQTVIQICHASKGVAGMYGLLKLSAIFEEIELAARNSELIVQDQLLSDLSLHLQKSSDSNSFS